MKIKIISLLICTLFLTSVFPVLTTAKNLVSIDTSVADYNVELKGDLIKISEIDSMCDLDNDFVVYTYGSDMMYDHLYIYNITTGETVDLFLGGDMVYPKIYEHRVVFLEGVYGGFKMYNIDTGVTTDLIVTNWVTAEADDFQFYGDYIVYEYQDYDLYSTEIYLYNIDTGENIQLTNSPGEDYTENPCIYENIVAWQLYQGNIADIVMYNIDTTEYIRVTNTSEFESETFPSIYDNKIVYSYFYYDKVNGTILYGLKMYNIDTGDETTIFTGEAPTGSTPEIFSNIIAYSEPGVSLRLLDLITNINTTIYEGDRLAYPWNLNGNYIVFTLVRDGNYLYKYNDPPDSPEINGSAKGKPGTSYEFILNAVDPDGDQVKYLIDWGDGETDTTALNPSGVDVTVSHIWSKKGNYTIKVHAKDEYGSNGPDATFSVKIPRNRAIDNLALRFFKEHQLLFKLLQLLSNRL